jgi:hypothetical protein
MTFGFIEKMGGTNAIVDALEEAGYPNKSGGITIRMWRLRKKIPPAAQLKLMEIAGKRGIPLGKEDFEYKEKK